MFIKTVLTTFFFSIFTWIYGANNNTKTQIYPLSINTKKAPKTLQDSCIDLVFDTVKVIRIEDKFIELEFSIINKGTIPAPLFGSKRSIKDNVAVHFYFSGTNRMTRSALFVDGIYLTKGLKANKGMLAPNAVYTERIKLSLKKRISFFGVILLQLDAFDILRGECDETNNVQSITPRWY